MPMDIHRAEFKTAQESNSMSDAVIQPDAVSTDANADPGREAPPAAQNVDSTARQAEHQAPGTHPDTPSNSRPSGTPDPNVPVEDRKRAAVEAEGQQVQNPAPQPVDAPVYTQEQIDEMNRAQAAQDAANQQAQGLDNPVDVSRNPQGAANTDPTIPNDQPSADVQQLNQAPEVPPHTHGQPE
jgi:hypothetical protein